MNIDPAVQVYVIYGPFLLEPFIAWSTVDMVGMYQSPVCVCKDLH